MAKGKSPGKPSPAKQQGGRYGSSSSSRAASDRGKGKAKAKARTKSPAKKKCAEPATKSQCAGISSLYMFGMAFNLRGPLYSF